MAIRCPLDLTFKTCNVRLIPGADACQDFALLWRLSCKNFCMFSCFDVRNAPVRSPLRAPVTKRPWKLPMPISSTHLVIADGPGVSLASLR
jgi:hypothetical protein